MEIEFEWYDTNNPVLGIKNYIPICELEIRKKDKTWVRFVFKIDSGADTILMKESDCLDLGYSLEGCQQLEFRLSSARQRDGLIQRSRVAFDVDCALE